MHYLSILLLGDLSLNFPSPGQKLFKLINKYKDKLLKANEKLDDRIFKRMTDIYFTEKQSDDFLEYYNFIDDYINNHLKKVFNDNPYFNWIHNKLKAGLKNTNNKKLPDYFRPIFNTEKNVIDLIRDTYISFPAPIIIDKNTFKSDVKDVVLLYSGLTEIQQKEYVENNSFFRGLGVILDFIYGKYIVPYKCPLYEICNHDFKSDKICCDNPVNIAEYKFTCELGISVKLFGII